MVKGRDDLEQVDQIARSRARFIEGTVIKIFPQTRTAQVRLDGSSQYTTVNLGAIDPSLIYAGNSRVLLYKSGQGLCAISCMPDQYAPSTVGITLGDRWGSTELTIYNSATYNPYTYESTYDVAAIDSVGNIRYRRNLIPMRGGEIYTGYVFVPLPVPLTNDNFNGDSFSDVGTYTIIENTDWSTAIPADAKALLIRAYCRDSGSAATAGLFVALSGNGTDTALAVRPSGKDDDDFAEQAAPIPCTNGAIWYRVEASGTNTMDVWLTCLGYWL